MREQAATELDHQRTLIGFQVRSIVGLGFAMLFVLIVQSTWPDFFVYPYLHASVSVDVVARFWPLFLYAGIMAALTAHSLLSTESDNEILVLGATTSVLAGIWEEIGFRWLFICTSMIGVVFGNWLLGSVIGSFLNILFLVLGIFLAITGVKLRKLSVLIGGLLATMSALGMCYAIWWLGFRDPVYWWWKSVLLPITDFMSLGYLTDLLHSTTVPTLFMFGALAANVKFRDGHKYQGLGGMINAWYIGLIMLYATVTYGLGTAIVLHAVYDLEFDFTRYVVRKISDR